MNIEPSRERFIELGSHQRVIGVHTRLLADHLTPIAIYQRLCGDRDLTFLLESAESGVWSRWSFVGVRAASTLLGKDDASVWLGPDIEGLTIDGEPLDVLAHVLDVLSTPDSLDATDPPPFSSGMVGYLGYDIVRRLEHLPDSNPDDLGVPDLVMMLASDLAIYDHKLGEVWLVANAINFDDSPDRVDDAYSDALARVLAMAEALNQPSDPALAWQDTSSVVPVTRQRSDAEFEGAVVSAVDEILAGEAFQIVVSQRFDLPTDADALEIYRELRTTNPSPYLYLLRLPGFSIIGSSPEALVTVNDGIATTHPIAGTRPRGSSPQLDLDLEHELLADPKERAEHLMLVDLGRNDLGRVCEPGSIAVTEFMQVRRYSHVMHLEAAVTGRVSPGRSALDVTLACFPAGTLSGAPKVRAMEIIDELEVSRRGVYGGVVGYFDFAGNGDAAIAIRTALLKDGIAHVQAGGGIVADSVPRLENAESQNKAAAALNAVRRAEGLRTLGRP